MVLSGYFKQRTIKTFNFTEEAPLQGVLYRPVVSLKLYAPCSGIYFLIFGIKTLMEVSSDCNWTQTHNHLVHKRTLDHLPVFVYELSGCGFESSCSYLNFRFRTCFAQGVRWHSYNYRVWIHPETRRWHDKNIQLMLVI